MNSFQKSIAADNDGQSNAKTFVSYVVYKGKAALSFKPIPPTFTQKGSSKIVSRFGGMLLEFAPSVGLRQYDWTKKAAFLLEPTECGAIIGFDMYTKTSTVDLFHDPNMGNNNAGQVSKKLKITVSPDGKGLFISLQVTDKVAGTSNLSVPVTSAEFEVVRNLLEFSLPRFLGFDAIWSADIAPVPPPPPAYVQITDQE